MQALMNILGNGDFWISIALFMAIVFFGSILDRYVSKYLEKLTRKTRTRADDILVDKIKPGLFWLFVVIGFRYLLSYFSLLTPLISHMVNTLLIIIICDISLRFFEILILLWSEHLKEKLFDENLLKGNKLFTSTAESFSPLFRKLGKALIVLLAVIYVLKEWNINITPILGGLGLAGLAVSFAAKDTLENFFGGIAITSDRTFKVGDRVKIVDLNITGIIHDIGLRSTKIKTWDNEIYIVPNGKLATSVILNYNLPDPSARVIVPFSVAYGTDVSKVQNVVLDMIKRQDYCLQDPEPSVLFMSMGDFSLNFELRFWVKDVADRFSARIDATTKVYNTLMENNINIPFPTHTVYLHNMSCFNESTNKEKETGKNIEAN